MTKEEGNLKSTLMATIKIGLPGFVAIRHEDVRTGGVPDISLTGYNRTTWTEVKHATPDFTTKENQEMICARLASAGFCRYLVYWEKKDVRRTLILHPRTVLGKHGKTADMDIEASCVGFNHQFFIDYIRKVHL